MSERALDRRTRKYKKKILYILTHSRSGVKIIPHADLWEDIEKRLAQFYYDICARDQDGCEMVPLEKAFYEIVAGFDNEKRLSLGLLTFLGRHQIFFRGVHDAIKHLQKRLNSNLREAQHDLEEAKSVIRSYASLSIELSTATELEVGTMEAVPKQ